MEVRNSAYSHYVGRFTGADSHAYIVIISYLSGEYDDIEEVMGIRMGTTPVEIEYVSDSLLDPIVMSRAYVTLYSEQDQQFTHLFEREEGNVRVYIFRSVVNTQRMHEQGIAPKEGESTKDYVIRLTNGKTAEDNEGVNTLLPSGYSLMWYGTLDPEEYQEPYSSNGRYLVSITATDLGRLKRIKFPLPKSQLNKVNDIISDCLTMVGGFKNPPEINSNIIPTHYSVSKLIDLSYIDRVFVKSKSETLTYWEVLSKLLTAFQLRIEQRDGMFFAYDYDYLKGEKEVELHTGGADALLRVNKIYTGVELSVDPRVKDTEVNSPNPTVKAGDWNDMPRIDQDGYIGYQWRVGEAMSVREVRSFETRRATLGDDITAYALFFNPWATQGFCFGLAKGQYVYYPNGDLEHYETVGGADPSNQNLPYFLRPTIPYRLQSTRKERFDTRQEAISVFNSPDRLIHRVVAASEVNLSGADRDFVLSVSASLLIGLGMSLYQRDSKETSLKIPGFGSEYSEVGNRNKYLQMSYANVYFAAVAYMSDGSYKTLNRSMQWVDFNSSDLYPITDLPLLQYGKGELSYNQWVTPNERQHSNSYSAIYNSDGLIVSIPRGCEKINIYIFGHVDIDFKEAHFPSRSESAKDLLKQGIVTPNYVLLRDIKCNLLRKDGVVIDTDDVVTAMKVIPVKKTDERLTEDFPLSTDTRVVSFSPVRLRLEDGRAHDDSLRCNGKVYASIEEAYAAHVLSLYANRTRIIEGTFLPILTFGAFPFKYFKTRYIRQSERIDLRAYRSKMILVEDKPYTGELEGYVPKKV